MKHIVVCFGDTHCGSTVGLCPPEGIPLDDGGLYMPNRGQEWLWNNWEEAWAKIKSLKRKHRQAKLHLVLNGDLTDGDHHRTTQIATGHEGVHVHCAMEVLRVPLALKPDSIHILRGTPAHVGRAGGMEEGLAKALKGQGWKVIEDPDTGNASSYHRLIKFGGLTFDVKHHGRMGRRAHTKGPYIRWYAQDIFFNYLMDGEEAPDDYVTETELLQQVQKALFETSDPAGAMSVFELSESTGMPEPAVRRRLRKLINQGDVEVVKVPRTNIVGTVARQYCYRVVQPKETHEDE